MKLLTVNIGDSIIETLDFERSEYVNSFILPSSSHVELLSFPVTESKGKMSSSEIIVQGSYQPEKFTTGGLDVRKLDPVNPKLSMDSYEVTITLVPTNGKKLQSSISNSKSNFLLDNTKLFFNKTNQSFVTEIHVILKLSENGSEQSAETILYLASPNQVTDVVLDFGSEASQINIRNRDKVGNVNDFLLLFPKMWQMLASEEDKQNESKTKEMCMQRDASDEHLYRSRFFVKKQIDVDDLDKIHPWNHPKANSLLKMLTKSDESETLMNDYIPLPNTKIASFGGVSVCDIMLTDDSNRDYLPVNEVGENLFYRASINAFLRKAIEEIKWRKRNASSSQVLLAAFYVLMPNVYDYRKLHNAIEVIRKDLNEIIKDMDYPIIGFELLAVSESDASFIGNVALSMPADFPQGRYLILDAGRGTLDFSIIKHNTESTSEPQFQNLYRDGIIGAGNAITYALLLVILHRLASENQRGQDESKTIQKFIFSNILGMDEPGKGVGGGDSAHLVKLMEAMEEYKRKYSIFEEQKIQPGLNELTIQDFDNLNLDGLINKIESIINNEWWIEDSQNYLKRSMRQLADAVLGRLQERFGKEKDTNIPDYVVFAGRGFLFEPFKEMIESELKKEFPNIETKHFPTAGQNVSDKNVCLIIQEYLHDGKYDTRLLGQPYMLQGSGKGKTNEIKNVPNTQKQNKSIFSNFKKQFPKLKDFFGGHSLEGGFTPPAVAKGNLGYKPQQNMGTNDYCKGIKLKANTNNDVILIGNTRHILPKKIQLETEFELFFANGSIWIRQYPNPASELGRGHDYGGNRVFESLFPYITIKKVTDVELPQSLSNEPMFKIQTDIQDNQDETTDESDIVTRDDDERESDLLK